MNSCSIMLAIIPVIQNVKYDNDEWSSNGLFLFSLYEGEFFIGRDLYA